MQFYVKGEKSKGEVNLKMIRKPFEERFRYQYLYLDVMGMYHISVFTGIYLEKKWTILSVGYG